MRALTWFLILALLAIPLPLAAQSTRSGDVEDDQPYYAKRVALIVGINYEKSKKINILQNAEVDANSVKEMLEDHYDFKCHLLTGSATGKAHATRENIFDTLEAISNELESEDCFLFYFAGHGQAENNVSYLFPVDVEKDGVPKLKLRGIRPSDIISVKSKAKHSLFVFDSCYSGATLDWLDNIYGRKVERIERNEFAPRAVQVLTSSASEETALDGREPNSQNSPFADSFVRFLRTPGAKKHRTLTEFFRFVTDEFEDMKINQHPQLGQAKLTDSTTGGDFHFIVGRNRPEPKIEAAQVVHQTLPGSPGKWWFEEMPWLTPEARLILDLPGLRARLGGEAAVSSVDETLPDPADPESRGTLRAKVNRMTEDGAEVPAAVKARIEKLLNADGDKRERVLEGLLASVTQTSRSMTEDSGSRLHLQALLLHALERPEAGEVYQEAIKAYGDKHGGLRLRCQSDRAEWCVLSSRKTKNAKDKKMHLESALECYDEALYQLKELGAPALSPLVKIELLYGKAYAQRELAGDAETGMSSAFKKSEDTYQQAVDLADDAKLARYHPVRAYLAERRAWTYMDQWKIVKAAAQFKLAEEVWGEIEKASEDRQRYLAFLRRSHAAHGTAMTVRLSGSCGIERYKKIREELKEHIQLFRGSKESGELYNRLQNTEERWADCHLFKGRVGMAAAAEKYNDSVEQLKKVPRDYAVQVADRVCAKMVIAATLSGNSEFFNAALAARKQYRMEDTAETKEPEPLSIYDRLTEGFKMLNSPETAQKGLDEIRKVIREHQGKQLLRDHQELLLLAAEAVTLEQQRIDAQLLDSLVPPSARENASLYFRDKQDKSIAMKVKVLQEDRDRRDFWTLVDMVQKTKNPTAAFPAPDREEPFVVFHFSRSADQMLVFVRGKSRDDWDVRSFGFGATQLQAGLRTNQLADVERFLAQAELAEGVQVRWSDDEIVKIPAEYPFAVPANPNFK